MAADHANRKAIGGLPDSVAFLFAPHAAFSAARFERIFRKTIAERAQECAHGVSSP
jgi:hypothetical protein